MQARHYYYYYLKILSIIRIKQSLKNLQNKNLKCESDLHSLTHGPWTGSGTKGLTTDGRKWLIEACVADVFKTCMRRERNCERVRKIRSRKWDEGRKGNAHWKHGRFALILSLTVELTNKLGDLNFFFSRFNQLIISFAWEQNWIWFLLLKIPEIRKIAAAL